MNMTYPTLYFTSIILVNSPFIWIYVTNIFVLSYAGLLFVFYCTTKGEKIYMEDCSGGMLLKSNTEAPGDEVVRSAFLWTSSSIIDECVCVLFACVFCVWMCV